MRGMGLHSQLSLEVKEAGSRVSADLRGFRFARR